MSMNARFLLYKGQKEKKKNYYTSELTFGVPRSPGVPSAINIVARIAFKLNLEIESQEMGGCKCTYRSCQKTSDGKTHFFHYPVKDEIRCNQWIINSRRPDLKNIDKAKLKNRVVCEHHFSENMFMNYKHERLVHKAVPLKEKDEEVKNLNESINSTQSKDSTNEEVTSTIVNTDTASIDKEMSTMSVNVSSVTGLAFFPPHEKKSNSAPYIEILTRLHSYKQKNDKKIIPQEQNVTAEIGEKRITGVQESVSTEPIIEMMEVPEVKKFKAISQKQDICTVSSSSGQIPKLLPKTVKPIIIKNSAKNNLMINKNSIVPNIPTIIMSKNGQTDNNSETISGHVEMSVEQNREKSIPINNSNLNSTESPIITYNNPNNLIIPNNDLSTLLNNNPHTGYLNTANMTIPTLNNNPMIVKNTNMINNDKFVVLPMNTPSFYAFVDTPKQVPDQNPQEKILEESKAVLDELKTSLEEIRTMKKRMKHKMLKQKATKQIQKRDYRPLSKPCLYTQILPFLSPETAFLVHKEMFPFMRYRHRS